MSTTIIATTTIPSSLSPESGSGGNGHFGLQNSLKMTPSPVNASDQDEDQPDCNNSSCTTVHQLSKSITSNSSFSTNSSSTTTCVVSTVVAVAATTTAVNSYSNSSSLESLNSATSSNASSSSSDSSNSSNSSSTSSNGSSSVAVKPVQPFISKMKATAAPFVSKMKADAAPFVPSRLYQAQQQQQQQPLENNNNNSIGNGDGNKNSTVGNSSSKNSSLRGSSSYPSPPPAMTMAMTMTMNSSTERLPASSACLVPDSVPVNVNGIIEHLTRYCPEEGPGISSRLISVKGEYFYATSTTGNGSRGGRRGNFTAKQSPAANCTAIVPVNGNGSYKGGKGNNNNNAYQSRGGRSSGNGKGGNQKNRHFSGPTSPTIPAHHHNNDLYPCALCPSANGHSSPHCSGGGADLREGREERDAYLRSRSFSSAVGKVTGNTGEVCGKGTSATTIVRILTSASEHLLLPFKLRPIPRSLSMPECAFLYCNYRKRKSSVYSLTDENGNHIITSGRSAFDMHDTRFDVLAFDQVLCLQEVLGQVISIQTDPEPGAGEVVSFPLMDLVMAVRERLLLKGIALYDIRLNGGAASYVLSLPATDSADKQTEGSVAKESDKEVDEEKAAENAAVIAATRHYNDIDLIFSVDLPTAEEYELVREAVLEVLLSLMPKQQQQQQQQRQNSSGNGHHSSCRNHRRAIEHLVNKMVKVDEPQDRWSLISLVNSAGRNVELKFVDTMRRQYEFSVDSFQIVLDTLLAFCSFFVRSSISKTANAAITSAENTQSENSGKPESEQPKSIISPISLTRKWEKLPITANFYPTVVGESMYGNFTESLVHLHHRLIVTKNPEEIRGGGLLKYISLLVRDYAPIDESETFTQLEPYMCTRFLIDFIYQDRHRDKLTNYLSTHFEEDTLTKYNFLIVLQATVRRSSSLAAHHSEALVIFEELIMETYIQLLLDFLHLYMTDGSGLQDFYGRAVGARLCLCSKGLNRTCHHRYLAPLYCLTAPLVVTYVEDVYQPSTSVEDRRSGLASFIDAHDELFPFYGGYTFAFLPSALFDAPLVSNHYVISSSTLKGGVPGSQVGYVPADPPSPTDFMCTFLMKTSSSASAPGSPSLAGAVTGTNAVPGTGGNFVKIIPLGVQDLLPKSFYPVDAGERLQNYITPALASHLFLPITPPPAYRLCIVNRVPVYHSATIASGPIYHSAIFSAHANSAPPLPTIPSGITLEPLYVHARAHSTYGQNLVHLNHPHAHHHPHHHQYAHQHHHHHHHPHGALSLYQSISPYPQPPPLQPPPPPAAAAAAAAQPVTNSNYTGRNSKKTGNVTYYSTPHGQNNGYRGGNGHHYSQQQHHQQQQQHQHSHQQHGQYQQPNPHHHSANHYHHQHPNHHYQHHQHQHQHPMYQHSVSMPAGAAGHNCSEVMMAAAAHHSRVHHQHNQPEVEPLRIVYPRMPFDQAAKLFPLTPQALFPGCTALMQVDGTIIATTTPPPHSHSHSHSYLPSPPLVSSSSASVEMTSGGKMSESSHAPLPLPMAIPQISINDSLINLSTSDVAEWPAPGEVAKSEVAHGKQSKKSRKNAAVSASASTTFPTYVPPPPAVPTEPEVELPPPTTLIELYSRDNSYSAAANPYFPAKLLVNKATNTSPIKRKPTAIPVTPAATSAVATSAVTVASTA